MPDLPPSVYVPAFLAMAAVISTQGGVIAWCIKWARSAEREKDAIQDKWIAFQEQRIPVQIQQNLLVERMLALLEELAS